MDINNFDQIEYSKAVWELEKEVMLENKEKHYNNLIEVLDPLIESGKVLYNDFVKDLTREFEACTKSKEFNEATIEGRKALIKQVYKNLTEYYKTF